MRAGVLRRLALGTGLAAPTLAIVGLFAGHTRHWVAASPAGNPTENLRPVSIRLGWTLNANSAGAVVALVNGYYADEGLAVDLRPGGLEHRPIPLVASGADDMGFSNGLEPILVAQDRGVPLRILAVIHQRGHLGFISRSSDSIRTPKDWEGRRVGLKAGSPTQELYVQLCRRYSVDRSRVREIPIRYGLAEFLGRQVDVLPGSWTNEAAVLSSRGVDIAFLNPEKFGLETMGHVLFTSERFLQREPDMVARVVRATVHGWEFAVEGANGDEVIMALARLNGRLNPAVERVAIGRNRQLVRGEAGVPIGFVDTAKMRRIESALRESDLLARSERGQLRGDT